jgi:hypothetical protein
MSERRLKPAIVGESKTEIDELRTKASKTSIKYYLH